MCLISYICNCLRAVARSRASRRADGRRLAQTPNNDRVSPEKAVAPAQTRCLPLSP